MSPCRKTLRALVALTAAALLFSVVLRQLVAMRSWPLGASSLVALSATQTVADVDLKWYPPKNTSINDLAAVLDDANGAYGFIFNSSDTPDARYGAYNWCNMPHVRKTEYIRPPLEYELQYVEIIQRHHKRTPYASNAFPVEPYRWNCDDQGLYYYGEALSGADRKQAAEGYWQGYISPANPYTPSGWIGTCQFPQITAEGLDDSWAHGNDLYGVYHDLLGFLPGRHEDWRSRVAYRVTQNPITSQVAGMLIAGTWATADPVPLLVQAAGVDSLEPQYACPAGKDLASSITSPSNNPAWQAHLDATRPLFAELDALSGVPPTDPDFHASLDHYYDNLSARQCHAKPLPCRAADSTSTTTATATATACIDQHLADAVYRAGQWEYSHAYRDAPASLAASASSYGVWIAELSARLRDRTAAAGGKQQKQQQQQQQQPVYTHNVAHDGSVSRVLSILQVDVMVWPGMGSEVVFELYRRAAKSSAREGGGAATGRGEGGSESGSGSGSGYYVRVLFGGQVLRSSSPSLGVMAMVPVETLLAYFDGLVGVNASLVVAKCNGTVPV